MASHSPDDVTRFELEAWNRCAPKYQDTFAPLTDEAGGLLMKAARVQAGMRVLDLGCGPGNVAGQLAAAGADVDAVDYSEPMLDVARRNHAKEGKYEFPRSLVVGHATRPEC